MDRIKRGKDARVGSNDKTCRKQDDGRGSSLYSSDERYFLARQYHYSQT